MAFGLDKKEEFVDFIVLWLSTCTHFFLIFRLPCPVTHAFMVSLNRIVIRIYLNQTYSKRKINDSMHVNNINLTWTQAYFYRLHTR